MFTRIVVGVTKASSARDAAERARELAAAFDAELHLVAAFEPSGDAADRTEKLLDGLATAAGRPLRVHAEPGDPAQAICRVATRVAADLIVVGNRGLAGSSRWAKSVPGEVSRAAPCSVLIRDTI